MDIRINPRPLSGVITPPPSKSLAHRLVIAAALAAGTSTIRNITLSQDIEATLRCMAEFRCAWTWTGEDSLRIKGCINQERDRGGLPWLDCGESGSTLRFLIPVALALGGGGQFTGRGRLMERPQQPYYDIFDRMGIYHGLENGVLTVQGDLKPGEYRLPGNVSSQFFTGLLMALPLLDGPSIVASTTRLESADYVTMTMGVLEKCGIQIRYSRARDSFGVNPGVYCPFDAAVEADWSQGAFWYAAAALGSTVQVRGLDNGSFQGDKVIAIHARKLANPGDASIDVSGCPDLLPPLAVMAAVRRGTTVFRNAARLRLKESDRLATVRDMLLDLGGLADEGEDSLTVHGVESLRGGTVDGANDHRIVMAAAIAATRCEQPVTILGAEAVKKSYPSFWRDYEHLGGEVLVV
ncbi:MAG: 3-phosphoshikimate 1-carboxyvinyltransferase [Oscillibacter sp.]|nr:3-phosphoshikimate 1-carboxyvinyltransferase [Oscillibacter sp.]